MAEYIEREALMRQVQKKKYEVANERFTEGFNDAILRVRSMIHSAPAADVAEVQRGEWIRHEKDGAIFADYECSICSAYPTGGIRSYYCPNCGAKMDGGIQQNE